MFGVGNKVKTFALTVLACVAWASVGAAGQAIDRAAGGPVIRVDWQGPLSLPPRFRNHCGYDVRTGRPFCSNHCGFDYQFYYCSRGSFGCCHLGFGYCDDRGLLRCAP